MGENELIEFAWLVEAPGQLYLSVENCGGHEFIWTANHLKALRFHTCEQSNMVMMALRRLVPALFSGAGDAKAVEHGWTTQTEWLERKLGTNGAPEPGANARDFSRLMRQAIEGYRQP